MEMYSALGGVKMGGENIVETGYGTSDWGRGGGERVQLTRVIASSSSGPAYLKGMRCFCMSEKYSLASCDVLVPKPGHVRNSHVRSHVFFCKRSFKKRFPNEWRAYFAGSYYHTGVWDKPL